MATEIKAETGQTHEVSEQTQVRKTIPRTRKMKLKNYFRVLGDSIAAASLFVAGLNLDHPKLMLISGVCGAVGKFVTNFFAEDETK
jgi:NADPH-dependent curcumin reductase CurA